MENILLTFTGFHDPYAKGLVGDQDQTGPILSLLAVRTFEHLYLFDTPNTRSATESTVWAIAERHSTIKTDVIETGLVDPTDYERILKALKHSVRKIAHKHQNDRLFVAVASGTPQMHACWVLLVASGVLPARILHIRPPKFVTKDQPVVSEVNLAFGDFPAIRFDTAGPSARGAKDAGWESARTAIGLVGEHPLMTKALEMAFAFAGSDLPVLLLGETGTGKELFARLVHQLSSRSEGPMVTVNCAGIPESLVESTLFGHKRGAFTGAVRDKKGRLDAADHGTIFFDELGDLPLAAQAKLLRVLQDGIVEPVGSTVPHRVDVRVVAATNQDLRAMVRERHFRKDLYYRLNAGELHLPPLRERRSDIPSLALHILDGINRTLGQPKRLAPEALIRLQEHNWPGNVRDLENVLVRTAQLCPESVIASDGLQFTQPAEVEGGVNVPLPHEGFSLEGYLDHVRTGAIRRALEIAQGNQSRAGRLLGITPQAVSKFLREQRRNVNRS